VPRHAAVSLHKPDQADVPTVSLASLYQRGRPVVSFEFFPPKTAAGEQALLRHADALVRFGPDFVTCTYGAGGSTRDKTLDIVRQLRQRYSIPVASHLTVVGSTVGQLVEYLGRAAEAEVDYIVALRGDPPQGQARFQAAPGGLSFANELVTLIRREFPQFGVAVGGYPETHREAPDPQADLANLKRKVDAGADVVITQLFYDNQDFWRFRDRCRQLGIRVPIVPGILPITNWQQVARITTMCGARLPQPLLERLGAVADPAEQQRIGVAFAIEQIQELTAAGVDGLHFYVLNQSAATSQILAELVVEDTSRKEC
jgi:methylenetetrahydrofolate reductase (NADPH)